MMLMRSLYSFIIYALSLVPIGVLTFFVSNTAAAQITRSFEHVISALETLNRSLI